MHFAFQIDPLKASFHIPLHRYYAVFLRQAVKAQGFALRELLPDNDMLTLMMQHPLRVQVGKSKAFVYQGVFYFSHDSGEKRFGWLRF